MRIRILVASAALATVLAAPVIPAVAAEGSAAPVPTVTEELGWG